MSALDAETDLAFQDGEGFKVALHLTRLSAEALYDYLRERLETELPVSPFFGWATVVMTDDDADDEADSPAATPAERAEEAGAACDYDPFRHDPRVHAMRCATSEQDRYVRDNLLQDARDRRRAQWYE